jgi:hypothetical protein
MMGAATPERIAVAGDWHCNTRWATSVITGAAARLAGEAPKIILHTGDFGYWPDDTPGQYYLMAVDEALRHHGMYLSFADGNHEDHLALGSLLDGDDVMPVRERIRWLPRGTRWAWHGRTWLVLGGAHSVDKGFRTEDLDWFPAETITRQQADTVIAAGGADVMLTHDCPSSVPPTLSSPPREWLPQIPAAEAHRNLLDEVVRQVQPSHLIHGHYHIAYSRPARMPYAAHGGILQATGLACDGMDGNWAILNVRTMEWETG